MNRRDFILAAVLINTGLLSVLFILANTSDDEKINHEQEISQNIVFVADDKPQPVLIDTHLPQTAEVVDEVDNVLKDYAAAIISNDFYDDPPEHVNLANLSSEPKPTGKFVEITVKRGDALQKIAKANGSTVDSIKQANHLMSDRLYIGQVLKVPAGTSVKTQTPPKAKEIAMADAADAQYYTIKSGDNPWKIAKQFNVKFEDLLKLNNLDEDKAKNLKIGEKIRVR